VLPPLEPDDAVRSVVLVDMSVVLEVVVVVVVVVSEVPPVHSQGSKVPPALQTCAPVCPSLQVHWMLCPGVHVLVVVFVVVVGELVDPVEPLVPLSESVPDPPPGGEPPQAPTRETNNETRAKERIFGRIRSRAPGHIKLRT